MVEVPVLAEKAVRGAAGIEYRQIVISLVLVSLAYPSGHAVGRQRITIPVQQAALRRAGQMDQFPILNGPQATIAALAFTDRAFITAEIAPNSRFVAGR